MIRARVSAILCFQYPTSASRWGTVILREHVEPYKCFYKIQNTQTFAPGSIIKHLIIQDQGAFNFSLFRNIILFLIIYIRWSIPLKESDMKPSPTRKPLRVVPYSSVLKYAAQSAKDASKSRVTASTISNGSMNPAPVKFLKSASVSNGNTSSGQRLLKQVVKVFKQQQCDKLKTRDLIANLCSDSSKQWSSYNKGKEITARQLGGLLKPYGITSHDLYYPDGDAKGYFRKDVRKAYKKYVRGVSSDSKKISSV